MKSLIGNQIYENSNIFLKEIKDDLGGVNLIFTIPNRNRRLEPARCEMYIGPRSCNAIIPDLWVPEEMRNQRVATKLLTTAISFARSKGVSKIELDNITGNRNSRPSTLYERLGFIYLQYPFPEMELIL